MPRDAVSRTANVGTVGKNGLMTSFIASLMLQNISLEILFCGSGQIKRNRISSDRTGPFIIQVFILLKRFLSKGLG